MTQKSWFQSLTAGFSPNARRQQSRPTTAHYRPSIDGLEDRSMPAALTTLVTLGDSLTAAYPSDSPRGLYGDQSWVQQLQGQGYKHLAIDNLAVAGATSSDVLTGGQITTAAHLISTGSVQYATLIVGANDVISNAFLPQILGGYAQPFVTTVTTNIEAALTQLADAAAAAHVPLGLAVGTIPDVGQTPAMQYELTQVLGVPPQSLPYVLHNITAATVQANNEIVSFAAHHHIPVVDMFGLGQLAANAGSNPVTIGGQAFINLYSPDYFHPNSVAQGLLANAVLEALATAYAPQLERFSLSDQQILTDAGIPHRNGHSYFDVDPYVIYQPLRNHGHEIGRTTQTTFASHQPAWDDCLALAVDGWLSGL